MNIEIVVFIYIALCICMLLYNLIYMGYNKTDEKISYKRIKKWKRRIFDKKTQTQLLNSKLVHLKELFLFEEALNYILDVDKNIVSSYLNLNKDSFLYLARMYENKDSMKKAYYAYMMSKYSFNDDNIELQIAKVLVNYTIDPSIYCRENALKALYSGKNVEVLVDALRQMNRSNITHSSRLVTDGLITFKGDKLSLAEELWKYKHEFSLEYQIAFIDFAKITTDKFCERFYKFLNEDNTDNEIKFAIIRYFRKYRYEPARSYLHNCITLRENISWEFVVLATSALENYPSNETLNILKKALSANNWYVRYNAADSLLKLGVSYLELQNIYNGSDRYAREMIEYKMREKNVSA